MEHDLIIKNGNIIDGTGSAAYNDRYNYRYMAIGIYGACRIRDKHHDIRGPNTPFYYWN